MSCCCFCFCCWKNNNSPPTSANLTRAVREMKLEKMTNDQRKRAS